MEIPCHREGTAPTENTRTTPVTSGITPSGLAPEDISTPRPRAAPHEQPPKRCDSGPKSTKTQVERVTNTMANDRAAPRPHREPPRRERPGETRPPGRHPPKPTRSSPSPGSAFPERPTEHARRMNPPCRAAEGPRRHTTADTATPPTKAHVREGVRAPASVVHRPTIRPCPRDRPETRLDFGGITLGHRALTEPPYRRYRAAAEPRRPV